MYTLPPIYLFDSHTSHENLLPLSFTRPICDFRVGILTIRQKWESLMPGHYTPLPVEFLREKFGEAPADGVEALFIAGCLLPSIETCSEIKSLQPGEALVHDGQVMALRGTYRQLEEGVFSRRDFRGEPSVINYTFDIFLKNPDQIVSDFRLITAGRQSQPLHPSNRVIGPETLPDGSTSLFIEEGAEIFCSNINLEKGPVYIGRNADVMEGCSLRGPLAVCEEAKIKMGAKVYEGCTFGPYCKVGGEIDHAVMFGYSNKAHDGYLGDAVVGEWCNIGAGVNASNLKNDYSKIRVWNYHTHTFMRTELQFCGPIIGDHTKIGVNCMLNTATVLGVGVNIHGSGFPRAFVPSFTEGSASTGFTDVPMKKFHDIAQRAMERRGIELTENDRKIYEKIRQVAESLKG